jgi:outer membrane lipoprotein SlyB
MKESSIVIMTLLLLSGCASQRPVLYPNEQFKRVGTETANREIDECKRRADEYLNSDGRAEGALAGAVKGAATSAAVGGAAGGTGGAVVGRAGTGAAVGAAGGGAAGATRGLIHGLMDKQGPSPVYKNFVFRCLREKGYSPIGWE